MSDKPAFNGPPPAAVPMANNVPQTYNARKNVDGYPAAGGAPASRNLSKTLHVLTFVLLGFVVLGWISWIVFLAGLSSVTDPLNQVGASDEIQDILGFSWLCLWAYFFILLAATVASAMSLTVKFRHVVGVMGRGLLFCLAVLVSWLGVDAHKGAIVNREVQDSITNVRSRIGAWFAGEVMCLVSACLIAVTLLLVDQARLSASYNTRAAASRNANASSVNAGAAAPAGMNFGGANHHQQQQYGTASSVGTYANSYAGSAV